jgi:putative RecB family exonuclease
MNKIDHLSYSSISRYEQCPYSYKLKYINKILACPNVNLRFGKAIHSVLENLYREWGLMPWSELPIDKLRKLWEIAWLGVDGDFHLFAEGRKILNDFVSDPVNLRNNTIAIEEKFSIDIGGYNVVGAIDRVDCDDYGELNIIDYKTNRMLFTRDEVDDSLQMSIYGLAARELWPWAIGANFTFDMLRHGIKIRTSRTDDQLLGASEYVEAMGRKIESDDVFSPKINSNCPYCDYSHICDPYSEALKRFNSGPESIQGMSEIEQIAVERQRVSAIVKMADERKKILDAKIKKYLDENKKLSVCGMNYSLSNYTYYSYPFQQTVQFLADNAGIQYDEIVNRLTISSGDVSSILSTIGNKKEVKGFEMALKDMAKKSYQSRLVSMLDKGKSKGKCK